MSRKVSIIVPIYNAEKYLANCLGNLVNQTLSDIEIILVNDCSTDNSMEVINACKAQFPEIVIVIDLKENGGPGEARNHALQIATGEYIGFVDSDDIVDISMYEKLYREAKKQDYDIVDCGFFYEKENQAILYTSDELTGKLDDNKRNELIASGGFICTKIFRTQFLNRTGIKFRSTYILEDSDFLTYLFSMADSIGNVKDVLYKYTNTENSLSLTKDWKKYCNSIMTAIEAIYEKESQLENYQEIEESVKYQIVQMYLYAVVMILSDVKSREDYGDAHLEYLQRLALLKRKIVSAGYENKYISLKISETDLYILCLNDKNSKELVDLILK